MNRTNTVEVDYNLEFNDLYIKALPSVQKYILKNSGTKEDAEDIFQQTMLILHKKLNENDFELTASLKTYTIAISKNLWLKNLRQDQSKKKLEIELNATLWDDFNHSIEKEKTLWDRLDYLMTKITRTCQKLIEDIFFRHKTDQQVMEENDYKNIHTVQNMKHKCLNQIKKQKKL